MVGVRTRGGVRESLVDLDAVRSSENDRDTVGDGALSDRDAVASDVSDHVGVAPLRE